MLQSESRISFKCLATVQPKDFLEKRCKWTGHLAEYNQHVKEKHASMFHRIPINQKTTFKWSLPCRTDQISTGILNYNKLNFLFMLFYSNLTETLYFSLFNVDETDDAKYYYKFSLGKNSCAKYVGVNSDLNDVTKPISLHAEKTSVPKSVLMKYIDEYKQFKWSIFLYPVNQNCENQLHRLDLDDD